MNTVKEPGKGNVGSRRSGRRREVNAILIIVGVATLVTLPLFIFGFPRGQDAIKHYRWSIEFAKALSDGSIYPRWFAGANHGAGSPLPIYYPPLPFYVAAAFNAVVGNMLTAISLACWLALALSGLTMYWFSRLTLSRPFSLMAAALYMLIPYHILDLYLGSAISEFWSFAWVPLIFYFVYRVSKQDGWYAVPGLAASYALLLLTHVPSAFLTSLALPIFALALSRDYKRLVRLAAGLALGAGMSAIFIVPVLFERKYIQIGRVILRRDYRSYFLFEQLGEGFKSIVNLSGGSDYSLQTDMAGFGILSLLLISSTLLWRWWRPGGQDGRKTHWRASLIIAALTLLMTTRLTTPLYRTVRGLTFLLFPFRWLLVSSACAAFLTAVAVLLARREAHRARILFIVALTLAVSFNLLVSARAIARMPRQNEKLEKRRSRREAPEYHPVWWNGKQIDALQEVPVVVDSGDAIIEAIDEKGVKQSYNVRAGSDSLLTFRTLFFPGWVARVDGGEVGVDPSKDGYIELKIDAGEHQVSLSFEDTWPRKAGAYISAICVLAFLGLLFLGRFVTRRRVGAGDSGRMLETPPSL